VIHQREFCSEQKKILADLPQHHPEHLFRFKPRPNLRLGIRDLNRRTGSQ